MLLTSHHELKLGDGNTELHHNVVERRLERAREVLVWELARALSAAIKPHVTGDRRVDPDMGGDVGACTLHACKTLKRIHALLLE